MMKTRIAALIAVLISLNACTQKSNKENVNTEPAKPLTEEKVERPVAFDINNVAVSTKDIGDFPYLSIPDGYKYVDEKTKDFEEKYFFYKDSLLTKIGGKYFHTKVLTAAGFSDTFLVDDYRQAIDKLGGVEIYSGWIPKKASELIKKEEPSYIEDIYDPYPYKYKQFIIRTPKENVWIELIHGLNAEFIDLTVVREEAQKK